jgi:glutathione S-transferase
MILIGRYDSPYVRRVGVSLHALAISFELLPLSPFSQASATAASDKAIAISYERRRPSERIFFDWIARCRTQLDAALAELETFKRSSWPIHDRLMQTDITTVCMLGYVRRVEPGALLDGRYPNLEELATRCEEHSAFKACSQAA